MREQAITHSPAVAAGGCTERKPAENGTSGTKNVAPGGTERHRDQAGDQGRDHETKGAFGLGQQAEELLAAVANGSSTSIELAGQLVRAILDEPLVKGALALDELLRTQSPFALVRAIELADAVLSRFGRAKRMAP